MVMNEGGRKLSPWQQKIHEVIFGYQTFGGKLFDIVLLMAILASIVLIMLESIREIRQQYFDLFEALEWFFTILFTLEYIARILSSPRPVKYILSFMGVVDLLSLIPTYLGIFIDGANALVVIRSIRLIRVFRVLKLTHFMGGAAQLGSALWLSRHKILVFLGTVLCIVVIMGTCMYMIESPESGFTSIPKSIYWTIVTITTVGYGDIAPQTVLGQTLASVLMIIGYAIIAVPTGIVTQQLMTNQSHGKASCARCGQSPLAKQANYCHKCGERVLKEQPA